MLSENALISRNTSERCDVILGRWSERACAISQSKQGLGYTALIGYSISTTGALAAITSAS